MKKKLIISIAIISLFLSCKKTQPEIDMPVDACECLKEIRTSFDIGQYWEDSQGNPIEFISLDTIHNYFNYEVGSPPSLSSVLVNFKTQNTSAFSYEWQIGTNSTTYNTPDVNLYFNDTIGTITARLVTISQPRPECFPNDDGIDTVYKNICIKSLSPPPLLGTYFGHLKSNPNHSFYVEIDTFVNTTNGYSIHYGVSNLPEGNQFDELGQLKTMSFGGIYEGGGTQGIYYQFDAASKPMGILRNNNQLSIKFSAKQYSTDGNWSILESWSNDEFIGIKQ